MRVTRFFFEGRVQGVGFRWQAVEQARVLGLSGWVRNLVDGRVEALVAGEASVVQQWLDYLLSGPGSIRVDRHTREDEPAEVLQGERAGFHAML